MGGLIRKSKIVLGTEQGKLEASQGFSSITGSLAVSSFSAKFLGIGLRNCLHPVLEFQKAWKQRIEKSHACCMPVSIFSGLFC